MSHVDIRIATADDVGGVLAIWSSSRSPVAATVDTEELVLRLLERSPDALLVADHDGRIVGTLVAAWDGWRGNMYRLAVLPEYRRDGLARRLVEVGHETLRAKGAHRINALASAEDDRALGFWQAVGYQHDAHIARLVTSL
jgi:ribosomal protein S18 acetylase RimI-like enzyme